MPPHFNGRVRVMNQHLMTLLADGQFHSGEALGQALGISRAAVWKQLQKLEDMNVPLHSVKGKGYRLPEAVELLDREALAQAGFPFVAFDAVDLFLSLDSTNDELMRRAGLLEGRPSKQICFAEMQTSGRGRRGRQWVSPFARNLYFSILWPFDGIAKLQGLSLAVGLAVQRALVEMNVKGVGLKWPNDVLIQGEHKLGGILIELTGVVTDACQVVIGMGLNLDWRVQDQARIDQNAIGLAQVLGQKSVVGMRNAVTAKVIEHITQMLERFTVDGFAPLKDEWNSANAFDGKSVSLILPSSSVRGICRGVNEIGELALETAQGMQYFNAGEVSLREVKDDGATV